MKKDFKHGCVGLYFVFCSSIFCFCSRLNENKKKQKIHQHDINKFFSSRWKIIFDFKRQKDGHGVATVVFRIFDDKPLPSDHQYSCVCDLSLMVIFVRDCAITCRIDAVIGNRTDNYL